ncbi:hypothetical protein HA42_03745 [Pantoea deleyi]|uniref:hypothetical protein n=1 Tax=Pantoea deleyi TaxID=470932 RepID=UPI000A24E58F|nr:hypothetical protein [Pantoea deleyi]ORM84922.1 hypothetical protein HA42_03745 [Pantoea deleyi]
MATSIPLIFNAGARRASLCRLTETDRTTAMRIFAMPAGRLIQSAEKYNDLFSGTELAIILSLLIHLFMIAPPGGKELIKPE